MCRSVGCRQTQLPNSSLSAQSSWKMLFPDIILHCHKAIYNLPRRSLEELRQRQSKMHNKSQGTTVTPTRVLCSDGESGKRKLRGVTSLPYSYSKSRSDFPWSVQVATFTSVRFADTAWTKSFEDFLAGFFYFLHKRFVLGGRILQLEVLLSHPFKI